MVVDLGPVLDDSDVKDDVHAGLARRGDMTFPCASTMRIGIKYFSFD